MSTGKKLCFPFVLRCALPVFGMGFLIAAWIPVQAAPYAYVANSCGSSNPACNTNGTVSVIDTATAQVTGSIPVGGLPAGVAVSPDGSRVYVANSLSGTVSVIDTANNSVVTNITVGLNPYSLGAFVGPGALIATNSSASGVKGEQIGGTVPALTNSTNCATSDAVVQGPTHGSLVFDPGTGAYTYTPASATYVGPDAFTWNGTASSTCTGADNPTAPVSNVATVTLTVAPATSGGGALGLGSLLVLGVGLLFSRSRRKNLLSSGAIVNSGV